MDVPTRQQYGKSELRGCVTVINGSEQGWDQCLRVMEGHLGLVSTSAFSPDGLVIVSGGGDGFVRLWDVGTGAPRGVLAVGSAVDSVGFSPDGKLIVSGSHDGLLRVWDAASDDLVKINGHTGAVCSVEYSRDGKLLLSGAHDATIRICETAQYTAVKVITAHSKVSSVRFSPDAQTVIACFGFNRTVQLFDTSSGDLIQSFSTIDSAYAIAYSPNGENLIFGSRTLEIRKANTRALVKTIKVNALVRSVAYSHDGKYIVSGCVDHSVRIWDAATGAAIGVLTGHLGDVNEVSFSSDSHLILSCSNDSSVRLWPGSLPTRSRRFRRNTDPSSRLTCLAISTSGKLVASGASHIIQLWEASNGRVIRTLTGHSDRINSVAFSASEKIIVSGSEDSTIRFWDISTGSTVKSLNLNRARAIVTALSPDERVLVSGETSTLLSVWDVTRSGSPRPTRYLVTNASRVYSIAFSHDGATIICGTSDRNIQLWGAISGQLINTLQGHSDHVISVEYSFDDRFIISQSFDRTTRVWDARSGAQIKLYDTSTDSSLLVMADSASTGSAGSHEDVGDSWNGYICTVDGWIVRLTKTHAKRMCWIPKASRPNNDRRVALPVYRGHLFTFATPVNDLALLDFSAV
jgi:WD40 repeat protein